MRTTTSRLAAAGAAAFLGLAVAAGPAGATGTGTAGTPEVYAASAKATALQLKIAGQTFTSGISDVTGGSSLNVLAHAVGQLAPAAVTAEQTAQAVGADQQQVKNQLCGTPQLPTLPAPFPQLTAALACSQVSASTKDSLPQANAVGTVAGITADAQALFTTVLQPIQQPIQQILGSLPAGLDPATSTVTNLLQKLQNTQTLGIHIGDSTSNLATTAGQVASTASAAGGEIDILGLNGVTNEPLAKIVIGSAQTKAVYDRSTGAATPSFDPALVTVTLNPVGLPSQTLKVAPGENLTILNGTPLQSTITVAGGSTAKNADGSVTATSSGVELNLLQGLGASSPLAYDGGIDLALAKATSSVGGTPAVAPTPAAVAVPKLPFTGSSPGLPLAGAGILGAALVGRRIWRIFR